MSTLTAFQFANRYHRTNLIQTNIGILKCLFIYFLTLSLNPIITLDLKVYFKKTNGSGQRLLEVDKRMTP